MNPDELVIASRECHITQCYVNLIWPQPYYGIMTAMLGVTRCIEELLGGFVAPPGGGRDGQGGGG